MLYAKQRIDNHHVVPDVERATEEVRDERGERDDEQRMPDWSLSGQGSIHGWN
jgi:hypothetical protein